MSQEKKGADASRIPPGTVINERFEVLGFLGAGGFANVYKAKQAHIGRIVALKILNGTPPGDDAAEFEKRFLHEAKLAAQIEHNNVVTIYDFGFTDDQHQPFIAMAFLEGHDLRKELKTHGPLPSERAISLFSRTLEALAEAHRLNIVHKDLKPSNLYLSHPGTPRELMQVLDFGVARLVEVEDAARITSTGNIMGTPRYLAPEYIRHQHATPALDVYQMGLILVEMLTGRPVVPSGNPFECMITHARAQLRLPISLLEGPLAPVLHAALHWDRDERLQDAGELLEALQQVDAAAVRFDAGAGYVLLTDSTPPELDRPIDEDPALVPTGDAAAISARLVGVGASTPAITPTSAASAPMITPTSAASAPMITPTSATAVVFDTHGNPISVSSVPALAPVASSSQRSVLLIVAAILIVGLLLALVIAMSGGDRGGSDTPEARAASGPTAPEPTPPSTPQASSTGTTDEEASTKIAPDVAGAPPEPEVTFVTVPIDVQPSGAEVFLDGERITVTPTTLDLEVGKRVMISVRKEGFVAREFSIVPRDGAVVEAELEEDAPEETSELTPTTVAPPEEKVERAPSEKPPRKIRRKKPPKETSPPKEETVKKDPPKEEAPVLMIAP